ncbi:diguanylate cyclase [Desulfopila sp. IMCC35008]|uniref:bifunctional diguanylate cyclase/phosphohydrolase n=1 Tax=Desulfopila sp. IMCC35008 TaxID=2653858 RepID=UPI0013D653B3|nr:diguanylate cyclase [Desulfopila sp. IMCC35008]
MNSTILFISREKAEADKYSTILTKSSYNVIHATQLPGQLLEPKPFLVIFRQSEGFFFSTDSELLSTPTIPVLLLDSLQEVPIALLNGTNTNLLDYLAEPVAHDHLLAKIQFLKKVSKLSSEHAGYLQSHDTFLDWFTSHDGLTGLYNRHHFNKTFHQEFEKALRESKPMSMLVLDIDFFNELNRTYGHSYGDFVLNELSARLTGSTRENDICFRFTGGDFIVLMPDCDLATAKQAAEQIRHNCITKPFSRNDISRKVTISIGIANTVSHQPVTGDELVNIAETALYTAKASGRNRSCVYEPQDNKSIYQGQREGSLNELKLTISRLLERTRKSAISSLQLLARDIAGEEHRVHIDKVAWYTNLLGKQLGLTQPVIETLQNAITIQASIRLLMHNELISKPVQLDEADRKILKDLPYKIAEITEVFSYFDQERSILLTRSEKYDGSGFPDGLQGDEIPLGSRIINVIDSFAAMDAERPYRPKFSPQSILSELKEQSGRQFDPFLVLKLLDIIEHKNLLDIDPDLIKQTRSDLISSHPELRI